MMLSAEIDSAELFGRKFMTRPPQRIGLRLAPTFRHSFCKVCKQHGEPEPDRDRENEPGGSLPGSRQSLREQKGRQNASDPDDKHDWILDLMTRVELEDGIARRMAYHCGVEQRLGLVCFCRHAHRM